MVITLIENAWKEGVVICVELEILMISVKTSLSLTGQHTHPLYPELIAVKKIRTILI